MILIIGGAGYLGSHVNKLLNESSYETLVLDNLSNGYEELIRWGKFISGDFSDKDILNYIFSEYDIDTVMHFASFLNIGESTTNPKIYYENNVVKTFNLLNSMIENKIDKFIFSSTCAVYGSPLYLPLVEEHPLNPINPYGNTKLVVEKILNDYSDAYNLKYCSLRYFNASGAHEDCDIGELHDPETHLIPLTLDAAIGKRDSICVYGTDYPTKDGTCVRDYIHVQDLADAHLKALEYLSEGDSPNKNVFNLGNGIGFSVREVIEECREVTSSEIISKDVEKRPGDPPILIGSYKKANEILSWEPKHSSLNNIIKTAWNWHKKINKKIL